MDLRKVFGNEKFSDKMRFLDGIFVLAINHLFDMAYLAHTLKAAGDFSIAPVIHRIINFIGFMLTAIGFKKFADISARASSLN